MKTPLLSLLFAFFSSITALTAQPYIFSQFTSPYENLSAPTVVSAPYWDDFTVYSIQLPFTFTYFGTSFTEIHTMAGFAGFVYNGSGTFGSHEIYFYDAGLTDGTGTGTSNISWQVEGNAPNRIVKIQTLNGHFVEEDTNTDSANVQLWLFEGSNIIEIHNGPNQVTNDDTWSNPFCHGPTVTIIKDGTSFVSLSGNADNPTASSTSVTLCVTGAPPSGKVYRFAPASLGTNDLDAGLFTTVYPNPAKEIITISSDAFANTETGILITNSLGQIVYNKKVTFAGTSFTLSPELPAGIYFIGLSNDKYRTTKRIVIQE